jgi:hypothetical protein
MLDPRERECNAQAKFAKKERIRMKKFLLVVLGCLFCSGASEAGAVGGPVNKRDTVGPGETDQYTIVFQEAKPARISVSGDGSTDLDCFVYDSGDHLIESDTDSTDNCLLIFKPAWTGKFKLKIKNLGEKYNEYSLRTN